MTRNACRLMMLLVVFVLSTTGLSIEEKDLLGDYPLAPGVVLTIGPHGSVGMLSGKVTGRDAFLIVEEICCHYTIPEIGGVARFSQMEEGGDVKLQLEVYGRTITTWKDRSDNEPARPGRAPLSLTTRLEQYVPVWMLQHNVPGVSIALIEDRQVVWIHPFGLKKAGEPGLVDENSVFEACSMSKPVFAYAVMKMVEEKKLDLDRTLDSYLPEPYLPNEPEAGKITVRMVLSHTTGLPNWRKGGRHAEVLTLDHTPGERFTYSGEGMWYLQRVVEHLTGKPINEYLTETLMSKIGMDRSSYAWRDEYVENYAHGHSREGKPKNYKYYLDGNTAFSLYTTPTDYARYLILMMDTTPDEEFQLQRRTVDRMLNIQSQRGPDYYYGLGWAIGGKPGHRYVFHGGSNGSGFRCHARFYRTDGSGIVVMTNADGGVSVYQKVLDLVYPQ